MFFLSDPLSGLILLLTAPLIPVFMYLIGKTAEALTKRQWDTLSRLSAHFFDSLQGLTTLKELGRSKEQAQSIAEASDRFRDVTLDVLRVTFLSALVLELVATVSTALVAVEVGLRLLYGQHGFPAGPVPAAAGSGVLYPAAHARPALPRRHVRHQRGAADF